jgi:hypothetical protein
MKKGHVIQLYRDSSCETYENKYGTLLHYIILNSKLAQTSLLIFILIDVIYALMKITSDSDLICKYSVRYSCYPGSCSCNGTEDNNWLDMIFDTNYSKAFLESKKGVYIMDRIVNAYIKYDISSIAKVLIPRMIYRFYYNPDDYWEKVEAEEEAEVEAEAEAEEDAEVDAEPEPEEDAEEDAEEDLIAGGQAQTPFKSFVDFYMHKIIRIAPDSLLEELISSKNLRKTTEEMQEKITREQSYRRRQFAIISWW